MADRCMDLLSARRFLDRDATIFGNEVNLPFASHTDAVTSLRAARRGLTDAPPPKALNEKEITSGATAALGEPDEFESAAFHKGVRFAELKHLGLRPAVKREPPETAGPLPVNDELPESVEVLQAGLQPCRTCADRAKVTPTLTRTDGKGWQVKCYSCGSRVFAHVAEDACAQWNRRGSE